MKWFWRLVCSPDCTDACQVNCPGCHSLADEWAEQGYSTAVPAGTAKPGRWRDFRYAVTCWSGSTSARMIARVNPARIWRKDLPAAGCGCQPTAAGAALDDQIRSNVRGYYDMRARHAATPAADGCCTPALPAQVSCTPQYPAEDLGAVPTNAILASLGCGNPFGRAGLQPGEVVLDLGSGAGMDAFVAVRRVGPDGHVFGLDLSDEMLQLAQRNAAEAKLTNVAFLKGDLESVPLPRGSVDVIISNCVVNLVPDKARALAEAFRVLRPGGRLSISDIVTRTPVPADLRNDLTAWAACIGGALSEQEYRDRLAAAGFVDIDIERDREYTAADAEAAGVLPVLAQAGLTAALALGFANTSIRAYRPAAAQPVGELRVPATVGHE